MGKLKDFKAFGSYFERGKMRIWDLKVWDVEKIIKRNLGCYNFKNWKMKFKEKNYMEKTNSSCKK